MLMRGWPKPGTGYGKWTCHCRSLRAAGSMVSLVLLDTRRKHATVVTADVDAAHVGFGLKQFRVRNCKPHNAHPAYPGDLCEITLPRRQDLLVLRDGNTVDSSEVSLDQREMSAQESAAFRSRRGLAPSPLSHSSVSLSACFRSSARWRLEADRKVRRGSSSGFRKALPESSELSCPHQVSARTTRNERASLVAVGQLFNKCGQQ